MLGNNISLNKFEKVEIMSGICSDHSAMRLAETNCKKKRANTANMCNINHATKQPIGHWKNQRRKKKKYWESNENGNRTIQTVRDAAESFKREAYSDSSLPQETRKISNKWSKLTSKGTIKEKNKQNPKLVERKK